MIRVTNQFSLDESELDFRYKLASGPGGQKVNKTSSAVELRFDVGNSPSLPEAVRARLLLVAGNQINADGILIIHARNKRSQAKNRAEAVRRLTNLLATAFEEPKKRKKTRPSTQSIRRRLEKKRRRSESKSLRKKIHSGEYD